MSQVDYCASKFACVGLDEALRVETLVQVIYRLCLFVCFLFSLFSLFVCLRWSWQGPQGWNPETLNNTWPHTHKCFSTVEGFFGWWFLNLAGQLWLHQDHCSLPRLHQHWHVWWCTGITEKNPRPQAGLYSFLLQSKIIQILDPQFVADQVVN